MLGSVVRDGLLDRDAKQLADRRSWTATLSALNICWRRISLPGPDWRWVRTTTPDANYGVASAAHHPYATAAFSKSPVIDEETRNGVGQRRLDIEHGTVAHRSTWRLSTWK